MEGKEEACTYLNAIFYAYVSIQVIVYNFRIYYYLKLPSPTTLTSTYSRITSVRIRSYFTPLPLSRNTIPDPATHPLKIATGNIVTFVISRKGFYALTEWDMGNPQSALSNKSITQWNREKRRENEWARLKGMWEDGGDGVGGRGRRNTAKWTNNQGSHSKNDEKRETGCHRQQQARLSDLRLLSSFPIVVLESRDANTSSRSD